MRASGQIERVVVTGAAGFIGSHTVDRLLEDGVEVWGLDNFDTFYSRAVKESNLATARTDPGFHLVEGDLRDDACLEGLIDAARPDAIVHLAARAGVRPSIEDPEGYYDNNVMGTVRLLEAMRRYEVRALVFGSSSSVYGGRTDGRPFSEDDAVDRPYSPYAATKLAGELLCHTYYHLHGIRCYCLRFFTVYGPRQRPDLAIHKFSRLIAQGEPLPIYGDGTAERDFTYVDDVLDAILASLEGVALGDGSGYEVLNVGATRRVTVNELVSLLAEALDREPELEYGPPQPGDVPTTWADVSRARRVLGYAPKVGIREGLRRFAEWFRAQQESTEAAAGLGRSPDERTAIESRPGRTATPHQDS